MYKAVDKHQPSCFYKLGGTTKDFAPNLFLLFTQILQAHICVGKEVQLCVCLCVCTCVGMHVLCEGVRTHTGE